MHDIFGKKYKFALFDMDGTLIDSLGIWYEMFSNVLKNRGINAAKEKVIEIAFYQNSRLGELGVVDTKQFWKDIEILSEMNIPKAKLFEGVKDYLKVLRYFDMKIGICTGSDKKATSAMLATHKLESFFDVLITNDDVKKRKPDPEGVFAACKYVNIQIEDTLYFGDSIVDFHTTQNCKIDFAFHENLHNLPYILQSDQRELTNAKISRFRSFLELK